MCPIHTLPSHPLSPSITAHHAGIALDISSLLEFSRLLNKLDDPVAVTGNALLALMGKLALVGGAVALPVEKDRFRVVEAKGRATRLLDTEFSAFAPVGAEVIELSALPDAESRTLLAEARIGRIMPMTFADDVVALVLLGTGLLPRSYSPESLAYAQLVGAITAVALEGCYARSRLHEANRRLERRVQRLRSLFEAGREFNLLPDAEAILRLLGFSLMGALSIRRFAVLLTGARGLEVAVNRFKEEIGLDALNALECSTARLLEENESDPALRQLWTLGVRATVPLEAAGELRGVLLAGERLQFTFDEEAMEYVSSLGALAVGALENLRLLSERLARQKLEEDLRIAAGIQQGLLPRALPAISGFDIAGQTIPAQHVGGDCYDVIELGDERYLFTIADVAGKGTPASLLMATMQATVRALAGLELPLDEIVARVNDLLYRNTSADKFITAFFAILDASTSRLAYVNAGHNPPLLKSGGEIVPLDRGGLILGITPTLIPYEVGVVEFAPGDLLLLYTDGVSEAMNARIEEYGDQRLRSLVWARAFPSAEEWMEALREDVRAFVDGAPQSDDITIVTILRD